MINVLSSAVVLSSEATVEPAAAELLEEGVSPQPAKEAAKSRADNSNASFFMLGSLLEFRNKYSLRLRILYIFFVGLQGKKQRINGYLPENLCEKRV